MGNFTERKLTKRGRFQEITSLLYGAVAGGKAETCESACERVIEWLREPVTLREFFAQYEDLEREVERMVSAYPEGAPSDDVAIQWLDLMDTSSKRQLRRPNSMPLRSGQSKTRSGLSTPNGMGLEIAYTRWRKQLNYWPPGKGNP